MAMTPMIKQEACSFLPSPTYMWEESTHIDYSWVLRGPQLNPGNKGAFWDDKLGVVASGMGICWVRDKNARADGWVNAGHGCSKDEIELKFIELNFL